MFTLQVEGRDLPTCPLKQAGKRSRRRPRSADDSSAVANTTQVGTTITHPELEQPEDFQVARIAWKKFAFWFVSLDGHNFLEVGGDPHGAPIEEVVDLFNFKIKGRPMPLHFERGFLEHYGAEFDSARMN